MADALNLVFDLDGTLIDSAPQIHAAVNSVFAAKGLSGFSQETVRGFIGNGVEVLFDRLLAFKGLTHDADLQAELVGNFVRLYEEAFDLTALYPGVSTAVSDLAAAGHHLAICTNKPEGPTHAVLRHFGLEKFFTVVVGGDTLPRRKPDPAPLLSAMSALGPRHTIFIGDSEVDAETARAADVPLALFTRGYRRTAPEDLSAKLIFDDHAALPRLIAHLAPRL